MKNDICWTFLSKFARPLADWACQIISNVFLISTLFIFRSFLKKCNGNKLKQHFRAQDISSSSNFWNLCSNCCFLFEKCAREAASLGASGHVHSQLFWCMGLLFAKPFSEQFFSGKWCQMDTKMASKVEKILSKMTLEMKSKKHAQNVLKWMQQDLCKTSFRMKRL